MKLGVRPLRLPIHTTVRPPKNESTHSFAHYLTPRKHVRAHTHTHTTHTHTSSMRAHRSVATQHCGCSGAAGEGGCEVRNTAGCQ
eukprot:scaffold203009_cov21-Tisochrysis_lutea.AAC.1